MDTKLINLTDIKDEHIDIYVFFENAAPFESEEHAPGTRRTESAGGTLYVDRYLNKDGVTVYTVWR